MGGDRSHGTAPASPAGDLRRRDSSPNGTDPGGPSCGSRHSPAIRSVARVVIQLPRAPGEFGVRTADAKSHASASESGRRLKVLRAAKFAAATQERVASSLKPIIDRLSHDQRHH